MAQNLRGWRCSEILRIFHSNVIETSNEIFCNLTEGGAKSFTVMLYRVRKEKVFIVTNKFVSKNVNFFSTHPVENSNEVFCNLT